MSTIKKVDVGKTVDLNVEGEIERGLKVVSEDNLAKDIVTAYSPIGKSIIGKSKGDAVSAILPCKSKIEVEILDIKEDAG